MIHLVWTWTETVRCFDQRLAAAESLSVLQGIHERQPAYYAVNIGAGWNQPQYYAAADQRGAVGSVNGFSVASEESRSLEYAQNETVALVTEEVQELRRKNVNLHRMIAKRRMEAGGKKTSGGPVQTELQVIYVLYALLFLCVLSYLVNECCTYRERQLQSAQGQPPGAAADGGGAGGVADTELARREEIMGPLLGLGHAPGTDPRADNAEANRQRFEANRSAIAEQMLMRALPIFAIMLLLAAALFICDITISVVGWMIFFNHKDQPCDQPLQWWLLAAMIIQFTQMFLERTIADRPHLQKLNLAIMPICLSIGVFLYVSAETCEDTNPQLYRFIWLFFICQFLKWLYMFFTMFLLVGLVFWMAHRGLLEDGGASAAGPEFIHKLDTVPFSPDDPDFHEEDTQQIKECCICQQKFDSESAIKRTPCKHLFHEECLGDWLGKFARTCPLCRTDLQAAVTPVAPPAAAPE